MPVYLRWSEQIDPFAIPSVMTANQYRIANLDGLTSTVINGSNFTYIDGVPITGSITSMSLVVNSDSTVLQTMTGFTTTLGELGTFFNQVDTLRSAITWFGVIDQNPSPVIFSTTTIRFINTDGTFTEALGSGFGLAGQEFSGTISSLRHLAANGTTVLTAITGLNHALGVGASAMFSQEASRQAYLLAGLGTNTLQGFSTTVTNSDVVYSNLESTAGNDTLIGAFNPTTHFHQVDYSAAPAGVVVNLPTGSATGGSGADSIIDIGGVNGSDFGDTITGNGIHQTIHGRNGNDIIDGGDGDDVIDGGLDDDSIDGGSGSDTASYRVDLSSGVTVSLEVAGPQNTGGAGVDTLVSIENLYGSSFTDNLTGNSTANVLDGQSGGETLSGRGGIDTLIGGLGADTLEGGSGGDTFRFALADLEASVIDTVTDYTPGSDVIRILVSLGGDAVGTNSGNALVTFGNGYQIQLTAKAGQVIRLDFDNRLEYWDTGANASWAHYTDYINGLGQITDQEIVNDNGTLTQRHINQAGAQEYTDYFNNANPRQLTDQEVIRLDGVIEQRHYDVPGDAANPEWTQYTDYIVGGSLRDQEIRFDNGSIGQRHIGQAGTLEYTDYVTPGGVLLDQEVINLNGTREQRHYDPSNTRSAQWSSYIDYFNASSQVTARSMVYDGTNFQDQWHYSTPGSAAHGTLNHYNNLGVLIGTELF